MSEEDFSTHADMPSRPLIIVAPDKFKGTLTANEVAMAIKDAIKQTFPTANIVTCPMADGGEGTAEIIANRLALQPATTPGHNALMRDIDIHFYADNETCAVDSAAIVGLAMLGDTPLRPWQTTSFGVGEFISEMLRKGIQHIYIGIGGTASIDGGVGLLQALGAKFFDMDGHPLTIQPLRAQHLADIHAADFSDVKFEHLKNTVKALADVDVPLVQSDTNGMSSLSFAPQKGVRNSELPALQTALLKFKQTVDQALCHPIRPTHFQGAGGGLGYAIHHVLNCPCTSGATFILNSYGLTSQADNTTPTNNTTPANNSIPADTEASALPCHPDCIITGEGCFDPQSLQGKVSGTILNIARRNSIPAIIIAGKSTLPENACSDIPANTALITTAPYMPPGLPLTHASALTSLQTALRHTLSPNLTPKLKNPQTE